MIGARQGITLMGTYKQVPASQGRFVDQSAIVGILPQRRTACSVFITHKTTPSSGNPIKSPSEQSRRHTPHTPSVHPSQTQSQPRQSIPIAPEIATRSYKHDQSSIVRNDKTDRKEHARRVKWPAAAQEIHEYQHRDNFKHIVIAVERCRVPRCLDRSHPYRQNRCSQRQEPCHEQQYMCVLVVRVCKCGFERMARYGGRSCGRWPRRRRIVFVGCPAILFVNGCRCTCQRRNRTRVWLGSRGRIAVEELGDPASKEGHLPRHEQEYER